MFFSRALRASPSMFLRKPWPLSSAVASRVELGERIEEERTPYYSPDAFYPVRLGEVLHGRYQIATKLGYGSGSTVWLARDLRRLWWLKERYVAVKVNAITDLASRKDPGSELAMLSHISECNPRHVGWRYVRKLNDAFFVDSKLGKHTCLVFEPLREPLWLFCRRWIGGVIPPEIIKPMMQMILQGLDYLHSDCRIIHTDLKPGNIMVKLEDAAILEQSANDEYHHPLPQKHTEDGRIIHLSRNDFGILSKPTGVIQITDFDLSVRGDVPQSGAIQAEVLRAPEVILDAGYTYMADIWSLGVMLWNLLEGRDLFGAANREGPDKYDDLVHLAHITALCGPAPQELLSGRRASMFYKPDGALGTPDSIPKNFSFESTITQMKGDEKEIFIKFVKRMIVWRPEERSTAKELLDDPWLLTEFD